MRIDFVRPTAIEETVQNRFFLDPIDHRLGGVDWIVMDDRIPNSSLDSIHYLDAI